jgi:hypothetical protein
MAHTRCTLDKQGYVYARTCTRPRAWAHARTHTEICNTAFPRQQWFANAPWCCVVFTLPVLLNTNAETLSCATTFRAWHDMYRHNDMYRHTGLAIQVLPSLITPRTLLCFYGGFCSLLFIGCGVGQITLQGVNSFFFRVFVLPVTNTIIQAVVQVFVGELCPSVAVLLAYSDTRHRLRVIPFLPYLSLFLSWVMPCLLLLSAASSSLPFFPWFFLSNFFHIFTCF